MKKSFVEFSKTTTVFEILAGLSIFIYLFVGGFDILLFAVIFSLFAVKSTLIDLIKALNKLYEESGSHE